MGLRLIGGRRIGWGALASLGVLLGVLLGCVLLSVQVYEYVWVCDRESGGALSEFPAVGNIDIELKPDDVNREDCTATFSTTAPPDRVIGYYRRQLTSHGWRVRTVTWQDMEEYYGEANPYDRSRLHMLAGERANLCYFVNVTPSRGPGPPATESVYLTAKVVPPGGMLYPPRLQVLGRRRALGIRWRGERTLGREWGTAGRLPGCSRPERGTGAGSSAPMRWPTSTWAGSGMRCTATSGRI